ncbi:MAG TPA: phage holin family protein [Candidatus Binatia bacterium]
MARQMYPQESSSWSALVTGIVNDVTKLFAQEIQLATLEIREDIRAAKVFLISLVIGLTIALIGVVMLFVMFVYLIYENSRLSLWASYGIVAAVAIVVGAIVLLVAKRKAANVDFIPQRATEAVKEDIGWISSSIKTSNSGNRHAPH